MVSFEEGINKSVVLRASPRVAKREVMRGLADKRMLEGEFKPILASHETVLLDWNADSIPSGVLLSAEDREMPFLEELDLVAHVRNAECGCGSLRDALH